MNTSKFLLSFLLISSLFPVFPAFAENDSNSSREIRIEVKEEIKQEKKLELKDDDKLTNRRQNAQKIGEKIIAQLEKRFAYLTQIKDRLQTKITELKATRDISEAQKKLDAYLSATTQYQKDLTSLKNLVATIKTSDQPNKMIPSLRSTAKSVENDLQQLHRYLVDTLKLIVKSPKL